jgi:hypothetical protein
MNTNNSGTTSPRQNQQPLLGVAASITCRGLVLLGGGVMVTKAEADAEWLKEYTALRRSLFSEEHPKKPRKKQSRKPRDIPVYHDTSDGRFACGGGTRLVRTAGNGAD